MQEQQQQQLKAMLGPRGQLAYYGLRLPQQQQEQQQQEQPQQEQQQQQDQQQQQSAGTGGLARSICENYRSMTAPATLHTVRPAILLPSYETASSTVSTFSEGVANPSSSPSSTASTSCSSSLTTTTTTSTPLPSIPSLRPTTGATNLLKTMFGSLTYNGNTDALNTSANIASTSAVYTTASSASSISSSVATVPSKHTNSAPSTKVTSAGKNISNNMVNSISSSTNASDSGKNETKMLGRGQEGSGGGRKTPSPPSRMVTRSQTAAVRTSVPVDCEDRQHSRIKSKRSRTCSEKDGHSPRKMRSESGIGLDDFPFSKNPAGAGIEFGAVCTDCGAVAVTSTGWSAHQAAHRGDGASCSHCTLVFLTTHGRDVHQQLHREGHSRDVDDYCECGLCGGSFIGVMYLELHLLELHGRDALYDQRALHLGPSNNADTTCPQEDESGRQLYRCGVCHTQFTYSLNLDCHMALHSEVSYACALCEAAFQTLDPLVNHSRAHRFAGIPTSSIAGMPVHLGGSQVPLRRHTAAQRAGVQHNTPFPMWGLQVKANQHPVVTPQTCPTTPLGVPLSSAMTPAMSPAMLNYCMMMSLWGGDKSNTTFDTPMWTNYLNPAMSNVFNYINPYLLNNNNNNTKYKSDGVKNEQGSDKDVPEEPKDDEVIEPTTT